MSQNYKKKQTCNSFWIVKRVQFFFFLVFSANFSSNNRNNTFLYSVQYGSKFAWNELVINGFKFCSQPSVDGVFMVFPPVDVCSGKLNGLLYWPQPGAKFVFISFFESVQLYRKNKSC